MFANAALPRVADRTARKRREPRAEDDAGIEQIGIGDDTFVQARNRLVDQRQQQAVGELVVRAARALRSLIGLPRASYE